VWSGLLCFSWRKILGFSVVFQWKIFADKGTCNFYEKNLIKSLEGYNNCRSCLIFSGLCFEIFSSSICLVKLLENFLVVVFRFYLLWKNSFIEKNNF